MHSILLILEKPTKGTAHEEARWAAVLDDIRNGKLPTSKDDEVCEAPSILTEGILLKNPLFLAMSEDA